MSNYDRNYNRGSNRSPNNHGGPKMAFPEIAEILNQPTKLTWFTDDNKQELRRDVLGKEAEGRAIALHNVKKTQIRRFYAPVVALRQRLQADDKISDIEIQAQMQFMRASAAYAGAREQPIELVQFMSDAANSVATRRDFDAFARHFECVVAYHRVFCDK